MSTTTITLDIPENVIKRFFTQETVLKEFLKSGNKQSFTDLIKDV